MLTINIFQDCVAMASYVISVFSKAPKDLVEKYKDYLSEETELDDAVIDHIVEEAAQYNVS